MKAQSKYIVIAIGSLLFVGIAIASYHLVKGGPKSVILGFDKNMQSRYEQFPIGTQRKEVINTLGSPLWSKDEFCLPSGHRGYEDSLALAKTSNAIKYDVWRNGVNWFYCIGFDEDGLLAVKAEGND